MAKLFRALGLLVAACAIGTAHAALIERHLFTPGDNLLTFDTSTRLQWLDLTATVGLDYSDALASTYVTSMGFRFATPSDLLGLWAAAGITAGEASAANLPGVQLLLSLLGCTTQCLGAAAGQGWLDVGDAHLTSYAFVQYQGAVGDASLFTTPFIAKDLPANSIYLNPTAGQYTGSFLVRQVPEPATLALLSVGLLVLAITARRPHERGGPIAL